MASANIEIDMKLTRQIKLYELDRVREYTSSEGMQYSEWPWQAYLQQKQQDPDKFQLLKFSKVEWYVSDWIRSFRMTLNDGSVSN